MAREQLSVRDLLKIEADGRDAMVKRALVGIRDRFHVEVNVVAR